jgi:hypothetical protein
MSGRKASSMSRAHKLFIKRGAPVEAGCKIRGPKAEGRKKSEIRNPKSVSSAIGHQPSAMFGCTFPSRVFRALQSPSAFGFRRSFGLRPPAFGVHPPRACGNRLSTLLAVFSLSCAAALAQWTNQTITLRPGWNAVFLEVQPAPGDCDTVFAGVPVESVWGWNRRFSSVQYVQDPNTLVPGQPNWLCYVPPGSTNRAVNNLLSLQGDHAYLVKLANNASPVAWTVRGRASVRGIDWLSDSLNLVGFHVNSNSPPTFQSFFA